LTENRQYREEQDFSDAQARKSALLVGGVLLAIAAWNVYQARPTVYWIAGGLGALLVLIGAASVSASRAFHSGWMRFAAVLGWINSRILLSVVFYGLLTPTGLVRRLLGRDPLDRRGQSQPSYWIPRTKTRQSKDQFERQF